MTKYCFEFYLVSHKSIEYCCIYVAFSQYMNLKNSSHYFFFNLHGYFLECSSLILVFPINVNIKPIFNTQCWNWFYLLCGHFNQILVVFEYPCWPHANILQKWFQWTQIPKMKVNFEVNSVIYWNFKLFVSHNKCLHKTHSKHTVWKGGMFFFQYVDDNNLVDFGFLLLS